MRVAPNDPALAHALSRAGINDLADRWAALYGLCGRLSGKSLKDASRILRRHFGDLVLLEQIGRATGSRANALWIVLDADRDGEGMVPLRITVRHTQGTGYEYRLRITQHCVARMLQRTIGRNDLRALGPLWLHHFGEASALIDAGTLRHGDQVRTASPEGALLWECRRLDGKLILRGQTWVAAETAADAQVRADCAAWKTTVTQSRRSPSATSGERDGDRDAQAATRHLFAMPRDDAPRG